MNADYIPLAEAAFCPDCRVFFNLRRLTCPTCGTDRGWYTVEKRPDPKVLYKDEKEKE